MKRQLVDLACQISYNVFFVRLIQAIRGVPKIKDGYNPATWMLEVSSAKEEANLGVDFAEIYKISDLHKRNKHLIKELSVPPPGSKDLYFSSQYSQPFFTQCKACLWKQHLSYWRNPPYTAVRFLFTTVIAVMFGSIFWQLGSKRCVIGFSLFCSLFHR